MKPYDNDLDYRDILRLLEPRHAPRTSMRFVPPDACHKHHNPFWNLAKRGLRVAALLIVGIGIGIGLLLIHPDNNLAAAKVVELGVYRLMASQECRIDFSARILPPSPRRPFHLSPSGDMHDATLIYRSDDPKQMISLIWNDAAGSHTLISDSDGNVTFDGCLHGRELSTEDLSIMKDILYKGPKVFDALNESSFGITMNRKGDDITVTLDGKNARFILNLSDDSGRILSLKVYDESEGSLLMFETKSISYL